MPTETSQNKFSMFFDVVWRIEDETEVHGGILPNFFSSSYPTEPAIQIV